MKFPFLNREKELSRIQRALNSSYSSFICLYGRRRCGKSRLLLEALKGRSAVYYTGAKRVPAIQRATLAREIGKIIPGFDSVTYPGWDEILERWFNNAPAGSVLVLDEFPWIVSESPELPGILQQYIDMDREKPFHIAVCGSSQRMMMGLLLNPGAPLYARATELFQLEPMTVTVLQNALGLSIPDELLDAWAVWGGIPRYWEVAADYKSLWKAVEDAVLNPMGVLHREPERILLDDLRDTVQAASILSLIGRGCHRISEIAGRLGIPATSLSRPLSRLLDMGLVERQIPFGQSPRKTKLSFYRIIDPFLNFWFRFVEPNMPGLNAGLIRETKDQILEKWNIYRGNVWEQLIRESMTSLRVDDKLWKPARKWWTGKHHGGFEFDIVTTAIGNPDVILIGEAKLSITERRAKIILTNLEIRAATASICKNRKVICKLFVLKSHLDHPDIITAENVFRNLQ